jgi:iron(III) transport system ATP-binding protein
MIIAKALKLMEKYGVCLECGKETLTTGQDGMVIEDDYFERWCSCGWRVIVDEDGKVVE